MRILGVLIVIAALGFGVAQLFASDEASEDKGVSQTPETGETEREKPVEPREVNDKRFHEQLEAAAQVYKGYGRVDDEARWAPFLCRMPNPSAVRFSASADAKTHGRKLYWLYAKKHTDYTSKWDVENPVPVGQVIVKESWGQEEVPEMPERMEARTQETATFVSDGEVQPDWGKDSIKPEGETVEVTSYINPYVEKDGKAYKATAVKGLFVMLRLDPKTEGTDNGWVYGTLTPDGKTVTSSGRVASCMKCHQDAPRERLFGLPKTK